MNLPLFLYNFTKIYIPTALFLCVFYVGTHNKPEIQVHKNVAPLNNFAPQMSIPHQQPRTFQKSPHPRPSTPQHAFMQQPEPEPKPQISTESIPTHKTETKYAYEVELASGKFMNVDRVSENDGILTLTVNKGFSIRLPKSEIKSIKRYTP